MPIYEFKCKNCGRKSSRLCAMGETGQELACPGCGQSELQRQISGFASLGISGGGGSCSTHCSGNCTNCHS